jgi:hypothetical protein
MKIIEKEFNVQTGEETITERDETPQEETSRLEHLAKIAAEQAEAEVKAAARAAILDHLGLTAEEAQLLLGGN